MWRWWRASCELPEGPLGPQAFPVWHLWRDLPDGPHEDPQQREALQVLTQSLESHMKTPQRLDLWTCFPLV